MHGDTEVGAAEYDFRKLFKKKKLKLSTWLDLSYEGTMVGKLGCCMWLELDFLKDIVDDIMRRTKEETRRLYLLHKREIEISNSVNLNIKEKFKKLHAQMDINK